LTSSLTQLLTPAATQPPYAFVFWPLGFRKINPQYNSVQNDLILTLFSFDLNPEILKNSTRHPPHAKNQFYLFKIQF
jgi:hypothetical protein